ncbi:hypothetical protein MGSAQ_000917 [marine sediment metagenome]
MMRPLRVRRLTGVNSLASSDSASSISSSCSSSSISSSREMLD